MSIVSQPVHHINTEVFSGPLDLLLTLIERKEIDIYKVVLADIMDEYLDYITSIEWPNIEEAASFLVIAATLLQIKAKSLLPLQKKVDDSQEEEEDIDPELDLLKRLIEYKKFKEASIGLRNLYEINSRRYSRWIEIDTQTLRYVGNPLEGITKEDLRMLVLEVRESFDEEFKAVPKITIPIVEKMTELISSLKFKKRASFSEFIDISNRRESVTTTLMALLELIKNKRLKASQSGLFKEIWISSATQGGENDELN